MKLLLKGVARLFFFIAVVSFFVGGLLIHISTNTPRLAAEFEGLGLAVLCGIIGYFAESTADNIDGSE